MEKEKKLKRPNIVFAFADDWGRYASCYQTLHGANSLSALIDTPNIDRIATEGALFTNAFVPAPSCTPCRSSVLSGRNFWQTRLGAILIGAVFDHSIPTFPKLLHENGYEIGFTDKVWAPGVAINDPYAGEGRRFNDFGSEFSNFSFKASEYLETDIEIEKAKEPLYDEVRNNFNDFRNHSDKDKPFFYWWGPTNTHRLWKKGSGKNLWKIEPDSLKGRLPDFFPDVHEVREDVADYLGECMAFDRGVGVLIEELEKKGELDNTMVVVSGDHGIPGFPRAKCNLYDIGTEVALMARLPDAIPSGRVIDDMVNIMDLAPTFLEVADVEKPEGMVANSLMDVLRSKKEGQVNPERNFVILGRERHVAQAREWNLPYPQRCLRTKDFLYIYNFKPDRWPAGAPNGLDDLNMPAPLFEILENDTFAAYADMDASPTKAWMVHHRAEKEHTKNFSLGFDRRPREELYDLNIDTHQINNLALDENQQKMLEELREQLFDYLKKHEDPRVCEDNCRFENAPYTDFYPEMKSNENSHLRWSQS